LIEYFFGHAIGAAKIAAIRYGDTQISEGASPSVFGMTVWGDKLRANRRRQAFAFINSDRDYFWDCFFNHILNYGGETGFLPNRQISLWDK
jgi:hypothetical protein